MQDSLAVMRVLDQGILSHAFAQADSDFRRGRLERVVNSVLKSSSVEKIQSRLDRPMVTSLEKNLIQAGIDLAIIASPSLMGTDFQTIPYWATHWDLGHFDMPELPELREGRAGSLRHRAYAWSTSHAARIIVESNRSISQLGVVYGVEHYRCLLIKPLVLDSTHCSDREYRFVGDHFALYPAQFWPHKNHIVLLEAMQLALERGVVPRHLVLTGSDKGNLSFVKARVHQLGLESYVHFLGLVEQSTLEALYRRAAVVLMPSLAGPTNLPPLEALNAGTPVATTHANDAREVSSSGVYQVEPFDISGWARFFDPSLNLETVSRADVHATMRKRRATNIGVLRSAFDEFAKRRDLWS